LGLVIDLLPTIRAAAGKMSSRREDAEDAVQEAVIRVLEHCPEGASARAWAYKVTRNLCIDQHRQRRRLRFEEVDVPAFESAIDDRVDAKRTVEMTLRAMPDSYSQVLRLSHLDGLSNPEIADRLGLSYDTVTLRLHRARKRFRSILEAA
jgi:RNA polymerase sigma-70 factor (ECF subfamily)